MNNEGGGNYMLLKKIHFKFNDISSLILKYEKNNHSNINPTIVGWLHLKSNVIKHTVKKMTRKREITEC